jgi:hypothetical protein
MSAASDPVTMSGRITAINAVDPSSSLRRTTHAGRPQGVEVRAELALGMSDGIRTRDRRDHNAAHPVVQGLI